MKISPTALIATIKLNLMRRPLWTSEMVQTVLDIFPPRLAGMIESGELPWAFNLGNGKNRLDVRVLAASVVEHKLGPIAAIGATKNLNLPEVINLVLPQRNVRGAELQRIFQVGTKHIQTLSEAGDIQRVAEKLPKVGPNASPRFTRASLEKFMAKRRIA